MKVALVSFAAGAAALIALLEWTYGASGLSVVGFVALGAIACFSLTLVISGAAALVVVLWRPHSPVLARVFAPLAAGSVLGLVLAACYPSLLEHRWASTQLPLLDPLVTSLTSTLQAGRALPETLDATLTGLSQAARAASRRADLLYRPTGSAFSLHASGASWTASFAFNPRSGCWERHEENVVADRSVRCMSPPTGAP